MEYGFFKVGAMSPKIKIADCQKNKDVLARLYLEAAKKGAYVSVTPQLAVTGATCGDLFLQSTLTSAAQRAVLELAEVTRGQNTVLIVGFPHKHCAKVYNAAAVIFDGNILGIIPKTNLTVEESRYFGVFSKQTTTQIGEDLVPFGQGQVFYCGQNIDFGVELGEDVLSIDPPSNTLCRAGAKIIFNLAADSETVNSPTRRHTLIKAHSSKLLCAYVFSNAGDGESTTSELYSGHSIIAECGKVLTESKPFNSETVFADIDIDKITFERNKSNMSEQFEQIIYTDIPLKPVDNAIERKFSPTPFVPIEPTERFWRCEYILDMLTHGLYTRLDNAGIKKIVLGLSGGLDSTLTLIVSSRALKKLGAKPEDLVCLLMPSGHSTDRTKNNSQRLAALYGASVLTVDISDAIARHLKDIGHKGAHDTAYENSQARERTQILMDYANMVGGLVAGTGDLSEEALGWCTYNGDHMSMYNVISSVPKTLVTALVRHEGLKHQGELSEVLLSVADTPASPELVSKQKTEDIIGPYLLHDFFLYYFIRCGYRPKKIFKVAALAFSGQFTEKEILKWLKVFFERFFTTQFKRSCSPDFVKIGSVNLNNFKMPSDVFAKEWLRELNEIKV